MDQPQLTEDQGRFVDAVIRRIGKGPALGFHEYQVIRWLADALGLPRVP
jgi:hypothetical protein